uniref:Preproalbumin PawS1 n=1 Tax=Otopappus epaleaceus TaxID=243770 RepID=A0A023GYJ7_9ASTR|nr:preproalbumin PawS1 [Otopappus epaleaceus]
MAKLVVLAVLMTMAAMQVAFVEVVSGYRTSITTMITMEDNGHCIPTTSGPICLRDGLQDNPRGGSCDRRQIPIQQLNHCQMHLMTSNLDYKLRMPAVEYPQRQQEHLSLCCNQLRQVEEQCQCEAIKQVLEQAQMQQAGGGQLGQMMKKARMLPNQCSLKYCSTTSV